MKKATYLIGLFGSGGSISHTCKYHCSSYTKRQEMLLLWLEPRAGEAVQQIQAETYTALPTCVTRLGVERRRFCGAYGKPQWENYNVVT